MKAVIQRVKKAILTADKKGVCGINRGLFILLGVKDTDTEEDMKLLAAKCSGLRLFEDENEKMNLSVDDIGGEILVVSNFTLYADCKKGKRPSFISAARPEKAKPYYEALVKELEKTLPVACGVFGADMQIDACNDGPVTLFFDTAQL